MHRKISDTVITRLSLYSRELRRLENRNIDSVSSEELAKQFGYTDAQVRRDLSYFGQFGTAGKGYDVKDLGRQLSRILGTDTKWEIALVGVGNLGAALLSHQRFREQGFNITAAFDEDPQKVGRRWGGVRVQDIEEMEETIRSKVIKIGIVAVTSIAAQRVVNRLIGAGVECILNFSSACPIVPEGVKIRNVDLSTELEHLSYFLANKHMQREVTIAARGK